MTGVWLDPWVLENLIRQDAAEVVEGRDDIGGMVQEAFELARHFMWMDWLLASPPPGLEFITSDRPLVVLHRDATFGNDPFAERAIKVLPLSPTAALYFGELAREPKFDCESLTPEALLVSNAAQVRQSDRWLISATEPHVEAALKYSEIWDRATSAQK